MRLKILLASRQSGARGASSATPPATLTVTLDGKAGTVQRVSEAIGKRRPAYVFANYEDYGYGRFLLDDQSRAAVLKNLGTVRDDFTRALLWGTLWDSVREAELAPADFVELGITHVAREQDDVTLQFVLARVQTAFTRYLSDAQQRAIAPRLEALIYDRMLHAETPGLRITYFRAYREVATTLDARDNIVKILAGQISVPGVTLRSRDRFDLIRALVAAGDERAPVLLRQQSEADQTDDGRRYAYAAAAANPDQTLKKKYFDDFTDNKELAESWIEASLLPFNTPRQADATLPYLAAALRELPTLKRTRKIFFVNGWLAAFVGGQCGDAAARGVQDFLTREPALDRDLRLKVLEATDGLERCVRIRTKYAGTESGQARPAS